ncbi:hypothetical protein [Chitiniphilus eburneus]|uniref:Porin n=1 Tax=Chitiniphilus eburneus TaxID=2571148 RepID=A0A4U0QCK1_9NEIS|nr:hypothetical protein [Chitiniphilus eburneus]TJZ78860.1 hypothetical protein FAZ21_00815 [Chitiniphilus eburneus]
MKSPWLTLALLAPLSAAVAQDDAAALQLADDAPNIVATPRDWAAFVELALADTQARSGDDPPGDARLSLDARLDRALAPGWRLVLADRFDARWIGDIDAQRSVNTLKEAYLGWQPGPDWALDLGRINTRYGAGTGFNPTDFFKVGALRSVSSVDPGSLRENRLGVVMTRGQWLWQGGSLTAMYAPKLDNAPSDDPFSLDLGASNPRDRWLLVAGHAFTEVFNPQWLLYHEAGQSPQLGLNWSVLLGDATVAYVEWAGGRTPSLAGRAAGVDDTAFRAALATGVTWTAPNKLSLTLEYQRDNAAADAAQWKALQNGPLDDYWRYRALAGGRQALTTRESAMVYARWPDAFVQRLDLSGFVRHDLIDQSNAAWLETRWRGDATDLALQWQYSEGDALSNHGGLPLRQRWQVLVAHYF